MPLHNTSYIRADVNAALPFWCTSLPLCVLKCNCGEASILPAMLSSVNIPMMIHHTRHHSELFLAYGTLIWIFRNASVSLPMIFDCSSWKESAGSIVTSYKVVNLLLCLLASLTWSTCAGFNMGNRITLGWKSSDSTKWTCLKIKTDAYKNIGSIAKAKRIHNIMK